MVGIALLVVIVIVLVFTVRRARRENAASTPDAGIILNLPPTGRVEGRYWDGELMQPCSKCSDMRECPNCPQYALYTGTQQSIESFEVPTMKPRIPSPMDHIAEVLDPERNVISTDEYDTESADLAQPLIYDVNPQYMSSREKMGACNSLSKSSCARGPTQLDVALLGTHNDDIFDGERAVALGGSTCKRHITPASRPAARGPRRPGSPGSPPSA